MKKRGKAYLVGAGPGDPGLVTLKGLEAIREADTIIYDFLANRALLDHAREDARVVYVGKRGSEKTRTQEEINDLIIDEARRGRTVVRLKGGDPFIFGRGGEEAAALVEAGVPFEVIPGVTSATAAPACAGVPLTHRDLASTVTFVTGQEDPRKGRSAVDWGSLVRGGGTLVFLMAWKNLPLIVKSLISNGMDRKTPALAVRWGSLPTQVSAAGTLSEIETLVREKEIKAPMVLVVGAVVSLRERLNWFEKRPLFGRRIVVTRASEQAGSFASLLEARGAQPLLFPTIKTTPPPRWRELDQALARLDTYDWAVFTSVNGVRYFFRRLRRRGLDLRELKGVRLCAIGPATASALRELGLNVDLTPKKFVAESVIEALRARGIKGRRFLLPRALKAREVLPEAIRRLGGHIDVVPAYRTVRPVKQAALLRKTLREGGVDAVTFTSSSTVANFAALFRKGELTELLRDVKVACIGPVTAETAREAGLHVHIMPRRYTVPALADAIAEFFEEAGRPSVDPPAPSPRP
ncbi:MAG TPA: uroporphyrinogen-III C-methyltransferase [Deltaproteobacteria bacterium]|nr:uroporphyrinogen-III C-methyltransferase [Deltaproteobacteria bacterium]